MGTLFSSCTKANDRECWSPQEETLVKERRTRRKKKEKSPKTRKSLQASEAKDKLSVSSVESCSSACRKSKSGLGQRAQSTVDLTVIGRAIPILQAPITTEFEPRVSNTQVIRVQPNNTSDYIYSSEGSSQCTGLKKPLTGTETSVSLLTPPVAEASHSESNNDPICHSEESNKTAPTGQKSKGQETPPRSSHSQLLELLRIRLDMAANNMEINRLITNVDRALDRTTRALELGFRRIMAARKSRRIHALSEFQSSAVEEETDYNEDEEETGTKGEETCGEDDEQTTEFETEGGDGSEEEGEIRPPLRPRICWQ